MNYYQEITLLPDGDVGLGFLWQKVFQQVHICLVENKVGINQSLVAVGFPDYGHAKFPLGNKLRLFSKDIEHLEVISIREWLTRLEDFVHINEIKAVPYKINYVSFVRKNVKSPERIERDMFKKAELWSVKSGKPLFDCLTELEKTKPSTPCRLPFIYLHSQQTKQRSPDKKSKFPLFIEMHHQISSIDGQFDCYGLSTKEIMHEKLATVPQF